MPDPRIDAQPGLGPPPGMRPLEPGSKCSVPGCLPAAKPVLVHVWRDGKRGWICLFHLKELML